MPSHETGVALHAGSDARAVLFDIVHEVAHLLPIQGPIDVFIHHNTLHAYQHLRFEDAVEAAAIDFGREPYLSEAAYQAEFRRGRVLEGDLEVIIERETAHDHEIVPGLTRAAFRKSIMMHPIVTPDRAASDWHVQEHGISDTPLWRACEHRAPEIVLADECPRARPFRRYRDVVLERTGVDIDELVDPLVIRLCAAFVDRGLAYWPMPDREQGFYLAVRNLLAPAASVPERWRLELAPELRRQATAGMKAADVALDELERLRVGPEHWRSYLGAVLLALPGWAGLIRHQAGDRGDEAMLDYLAFRLTCERLAADFVVGVELGHSSVTNLPLSSAVYASARHPSFVLYEIATAIGIDAVGLSSSTVADLQSMVDEHIAFDHMKRRRLWQLAYERRHRCEMLDAIAVQMRRAGSERPPEASLQLAFCIDEREESMRRHVEELDPTIETFGVAGFFGVAMYYQALNEPDARAFCPVVIQPVHRVVERPRPDSQHVFERRRRRQKWVSMLGIHTYFGSRTLVRGVLLTLGFGLIAGLPLFFRVLFPRATTALRRLLTTAAMPHVRTDLLLDADDNGGVDGILRLGFTVDEKSVIVARVLEDAGLTKRFAALVVVVGHGSTSLNNPHESAHDCGACGGQRGAANARAFAGMANQPQVRAELVRRGIEIPDATYFVGAYHDTCSDEVVFFDEDIVPRSHRPALERARAVLDHGRRMNAHERCRRFEDVSLAVTPEQALAHVQGRSQKLAEPRPEYGHATNAVCLIGRRYRSRGLFLDRRAFLVSYDPAGDPDGTVLGRVLGAVGPVCAGINLEYYFSVVDGIRYGCGTKLPHNITGLVGVMDGHASDLRTGLPLQMVEIHEPVRLLMIVESAPDIVERVLETTPAVRELVENRWIQLAVVDPMGFEIDWYDDGRWERHVPIHHDLPVFDSSLSCYAGHREHRPPALIRKGSRRNA